MSQRQLIRALVAPAVAGFGIVAAAWAGAPPALSLLALIAGVVVFLLWPADGNPERSTETDPGQRLPDLTDLLRAVDDPLLIVRERRVVAANEAALELLGSHVEGADVRLAIRHPAAVERLSAPAEEDEEASRIELVGLGEAERQWQMAVTPLADGSRLVRLSDQSQVHAIEQMRVDFVANASHELRTPLATLIGFVETLQDDEAGGDPKTRRRFLATMQSEAQRMRDLVDDLLSLSRIEAERFTLPRAPVDLAELVDETRSNLAGTAEKREAALVVDNCSADAIVQGDRPQLAQMLANLVTNALSYGRAGEPVTIRLEDVGEMVRLTIIDRGEGIRPEHLPRLTERFYRVDAGRSRAAGGTGLGLAIVKHIVLRHRGRLDIRSESGVGTEVEVLLPRAAPAAP